MANSVLNGITVIDVSGHIAGPYCTKLLAEFGAKVIHISNPKKEALDHHKNSVEVDMYLSDSKQSITLDIFSSEGQVIFKKLLTMADILVESFNPMAPPQSRLVYEKLHEAFPSLIMTSVTPFGQKGPYIRYNASHIVYQAMGGWMAKLGKPDREPVQAGGYLSYFIAGACAISATMGALFYRSLSGEGQHIDISEWEATLGTAPEGFLAYEFSGKSNLSEVKFGGRSYNWFPGIYKAKDDKWIGINLLTEQQWEFLCEWMDMFDALEDPKYANGSSRRDHGHELSPRVADYISKRTRDEIFSEGRERRIPVGMVYSPGEMIDSPQYIERGYFVEAEHPVEGKYKMPGAPFRLPESPWAIKSGPVVIGTNTQGVLSSLGYDIKQLERLKSQGVI